HKTRNAGDRRQSERIEQSRKPLRTRPIFTCDSRLYTGPEIRRDFHLTMCVKFLLSLQQLVLTSTRLAATQMFCNRFFGRTVNLVIEKVLKQRRAFVTLHYSAPNTVAAIPSFVFVPGKGQLLTWASNNL